MPDDTRKKDKTQPRGPGLRELKEIFAKTRTRLVYFSVPVFASLAVAIFEGASFGLLIPFAKGVMEKNFTFFFQMPVLRDILGFWGDLTGHPNASAFVLIIILLFTVTLFKNCFQYLGAIWLSKQLFGFADRLRQLIFSRYLSFGKHFFDLSSLGHLQTVLLTHINQIVATIRMSNQYLNQACMIIAYLVVLVLISWPLTLLSFIMIPVLYKVIGWVILKIRKTSQVMVRYENDMGRKISNALMGMTLIKACSTEEKEAAEFKSLSANVSAQHYSLEKKESFITPVQEMMGLSAFLVLMSVMAFIVVKVEPGGNAAKYIVFLLTLRRLINSVSGFNRMQAVFARLSGPLAEVFLMLDDHEKFYVSEGSKEFTGLKKEIRFTGLNFSYRHQPQIIKNVNFTVEKGKNHAIVGETGSGKSTIVHLLMRFYEVDPGTILIDGEDIRNFNHRSLRRPMALISQETFLFNDTLRMNMLYGLEREVSDDELIHAVRKARLYDFIMGLPEKLDAVIGDRGVQLSGGEKQRIAIARVILKDAEILLFDEATSALDSKTEELIQEAIDEVSRGKTSITIAHRLSTVKNADHVLVLERGEIIEQGTFNALLCNKGKFFEYWHRQQAL